MLVVGAGLVVAAALAIAAAAPSAAHAESCPIAGQCEVDAQTHCPTDGPLQAVPPHQCLPVPTEVFWETHEAGGGCGEELIVQVATSPRYSEYEAVVYSEIGLGTRWWSQPVSPFSETGPGAGPGEKIEGEGASYEVPAGHFAWSVAGGAGGGPCTKPKVWLGEAGWAVEGNNGTISGKIVTPAGEPLPGVTVRAIPGAGEETPETTTNAEGEYSFSVPPGFYAVEPVPSSTAGDDEFKTETCQGAAGTILGGGICYVTVEAEQEVIANFNAGFTLSAKVRDTEAKGAPGATVAIQDTTVPTGKLHTSEPTTNNEGEVKERLAPGKALVGVKPLNGEEFFPVESKECKVVGTSCEVNLEQDRSVEFTSCVVPNPNGEPLREPFANNPAIKIPGAITTQNLEAVGCWKKQSTGSDYVSTQPVRLDGLDIAPISSATRFELDQTHATVHIDGPANLQVKGFVLWPEMSGATLNFEGSNIAASDLGLGESYGGFAGPRVAGVPLHMLTVGTGGSYASLLPPWSSSPGQTSLTINPVVPGANAGDHWDYAKQEFRDDSGKQVPNIGPQATITTTNRQGLVKPLLCLTLGDVPFTPWADEVPAGEELKFNGINACYDFAKEETSFSAILELPTAVKFADRFNAAITFKNYEVEKIGLQLDGLDKPLNPYFYWQRGGMNATWDVSPALVPTLQTVSVNAGFSFGPRLDDKGPFAALVKLFPSLNETELASLDAEGTLTLSEPLELSLNGNILLFRKSPFQASIAGGFVNYWTSGRFDWGGNLKLTLPIVHAGLSAEVKGFLDTDVHTGTFQLQGYGKLSGLWGEPAEEQVLINNNVIVACSDHEGSWFAYHWGGSVEPFPSGVCNLGNYVLPEPEPGSTPPPTPRGGASRVGRARIASGRGPFSFRIPRGLADVALEIRGGTAAPRVSLTGPGGVHISGRGSGAVRTTAGSLLAYQPNHTTYIGLVHPRAGRWTVKALPGSAPIASVLESNAVKPAKIAARVRQVGCGEAITYEYRPANGDKVSLYVQNGSQRTFFGYARPGTHRLSFTPAMTGHGRLIAFETHAGLPRSQRTILTFSPAAYRRVATPRRLHVAGRVLRWAPACGASSYRVTISHGDSTTTSRTRVTHIRLMRFKGRFTATVTALGTRRGVRGSARARLSL